MALCMFHYLCIIFSFFSSNVNCIVYAHMYMYVDIFSYLVNKLATRWLYLHVSQIEKKINLFIYIWGSQQIDSYAVS